LAGRDCESVRRFSKGCTNVLDWLALMHDPDLLVLDEPTDGLDPVGRLEMRNLLRQLRTEGKTIFLNSHILQEVDAVCDRVAVMAKGTLRGIGSIKDLTAGRQEKPLQLLLLATPEVALAALPAELATHATASDCTIAEEATACQLVVTCSEQDQVDHTVDAIRQAGIPIRKLQLATQSLEDAFFEMIGDTPEASH